MINYRCSRLKELLQFIGASDWIMHEIGVVILTELFFNNFKKLAMKKTLYLICITLTFSSLLTNVSHFVTLNWWQATSLDRCQ